MTPYMSPSLSRRMRAIHAAACLIWKSTPDIRLSFEGRRHPVSCHMVARGMAKLFPKDLTLEDGKYRGAWMHSWCSFRNGNEQPAFLLDVYPVGMHAGPIIVDVGRGSPHHDAYIASSLDWFVEVPPFPQHSAQVEEAMRQTWAMFDPQAMGVTK